VDDLVEGDGQACAVLWAAVQIVDDSVESILSVAELRRASRFRTADARRRFVLGAALLRCAAAARVGIEARDVEVERCCRWCNGPHGKPRLVGRAAGWHASVTHSGSLAGVALTRSGAVGLDVEVDSRVDHEPLLESVLSADESRPGSDRDFLTYWTRKESALKATGEGLTRSMRDVVVSAPTAAPRLISYAGRSTSSAMFDLAPAAGYIAALTVHSSGPSDVREHHVRALP
jgi:4'-phosphopantetheinyl transferase